jgi:hypothetical protein
MLRVSAVDFDRPFGSNVSQILERAAPAFIVVRALAAADPRRVLEVAGPSERFELEKTLNTCDPLGWIRLVLGGTVHGKSRRTTRNGLV